MALRIALLLGTALAANQAPPPLNLKNLKATDPEMQFEVSVAKPLKDGAEQLNQKVDSFLQRIASVVEAGDEEKGIKALTEMSGDIRKLLKEVVPMLLSARDNSSALDVDKRPSPQSQATYAQEVLLKLQTYSAWAWPVIIQYTMDAYGDDNVLSPDIQARMERGTNGSLSYLSSVLFFAWKAAEFQMPVVEGMMQRNDTNGEVLMKAGCAASYAQLLGDITQMYGDLSDQKVQCFIERGSKEHWQKCSADAADSLFKVTSAIAEASNAMWQCFGIYWGCSQLTNTAYSQLVKALSASLEMSKNCNANDFDMCKPFAFKAMASLSQAAGQMNSATDDCVLKGQSTADPLNPYAATPFMPRDAPNATL